MSNNNVVYVADFLNTKYSKLYRDTSLGVQDDHAAEIAQYIEAHKSTDLMPLLMQHLESVLVEISFRKIVPATLAVNREESHSRAEKQAERAMIRDLKRRCLAIKRAYKSDKLHKSCFDVLQAECRIEEDLLRFLMTNNRTMAEIFQPLALGGIALFELSRMSEVFYRPNFSVLPVSIARMSSLLRTAKFMRVEVRYAIEMTKAMFEVIHDHNACLEVQVFDFDEADEFDDDDFD
jgi:hypothetical protein